MGFVPRMLWRGRWRRAATAERYLQAAAALSYFGDLPESTRQCLPTSRTLRTRSYPPTLADGQMPLGSCASRGCGRRCCPTTSARVLRLDGGPSPPVG
eukprot:10080209-Alexandrium_andersonii.AAC.1